MHVEAKRLKLGKLVFDELHDSLFTHSPKEFFKIHRIHVDSDFFGWNHDVFDILVDGNK